VELHTPGHSHVMCGCCQTATGGDACSCGNTNASRYNGGTQAEMEQMVLVP
jgi:hypothetical protein